MAVYEKIVDPGGSGDYSSLSAWEAGEQGLYSAGDTARAVCKRTTSATDTARCLVNGWTTGVNIEITAHADYRHEGKWADTRTGGNYVYVLEYAATGNYNHALQISDPNNVTVDGLLVSISNTGAYLLPCAIGFSHTSGTKTMRACIVRDAASANLTGGIVVFQVAGSLLCYNCVAYGFNGNSTARGFGNNTGASTNFNNCTAYGCSLGFSSNTTNNTVKNCAGFNCTTCFSSTTSSASDYNCSSDSSALGTNKATGKTDYANYFVDPANGDFHLKGTSSTLWGLAGADLSGTFTTDIDGATRSAWDIGADEYASSSGGVAAAGSAAGLSSAVGSARVDLEAGGAAAGQSGVAGAVALAFAGSWSAAGSGAAAGSAGVAMVVSGTGDGQSTASAAAVTDLVVTLIQTERRVFALDTERRVFALDTERRVFALDTERRVFAAE